MTTPVSTYHQDKLKELIKQVMPMGPIGNVMLSTIQEVLPRNERLVACYYQLDFSEAALGDTAQPTFYSSVVQLLTSHRFIDLGFYPKYHSQRVVAIAGVRDVRVENTFVTGFEGEEVSAESTGFKPVQTKVVAMLTDARGEVAETWTIEASRPAQIDNAQEIHKALSKAVGRPLIEDPG